MKKVLMRAAVVAALFLAFVLLMTFSGDGISIDALTYSNDKSNLVEAMENEDYEKAAEYLSFYGKEDICTARSYWASAMENSGVAFRSIKRKNLIADDGITLCPATAVLEDGSKMSFRIVVQGKGLAIGNIHTDNGQEEMYQKLMTTYNPG